MGVKHKEQLQELSVELRAYINQLVSSLAPFCSGDSGVSVVIEKETDEEDKTQEFLVTVQLSGEGAEVYSTGRADSIIEATKTATETLANHLYNVQNRMISEESEEAEDDSGDDSGGMAVCH